MKKSTNPKNIKFHLPTKVIFGEGVVNEVGQEAVQLGKKALLVTGREAMRKLGITSRIESLLVNSGVEVVIYDKVEPEPSIQTVDVGGMLAKSENCDLIVGLGGGSVLDVSKGIATIARSGDSIVEAFKSKDKNRYFSKKKVLPILAVPTTSGTGSEVTPFALFTDKKERRKKPLGHSVLYPRCAIIDPDLMMGMSSKLAAMTGIDALGHAIEAYISRNSTFLSDMYAKEVINLIVENLPRAVADRDNKEAQENMSLASTLAGIANAQAGTVAGHAMAAALGGYLGIPHGIAVGLFLPHVLNLNGSTCPHKIAQITKMFGENVERTNDLVKKCVEVCHTFIKNTGLPVYLDKKIHENEIIKIAEDAFTKPAMRNNPAKLKLDDVVAVITNICSKM